MHDFMAVIEDQAGREDEDMCNSMHIMSKQNWLARPSNPLPSLGNVFARHDLLTLSQTGCVLSAMTLVTAVTLPAIT